MKQTEMVVNCQYGDTGDVQELIRRSLVFYLQRELAKPGCTCASEAETAVSRTR